MGAPSVIVEKLIGGDELKFAAEKMQKMLICNQKNIETFESARGVKSVTCLPEPDSNLVSNCLPSVNCGMMYFMIITLF
jgi:DUF917 family protein